MIEIKLHPVKVSEIYEGYFDNNEEGVGGYYGKLDIRPKYQREFIYNDEDMRNVIYTIMMDCPLNTMYWAVAEDGTFELLDGQQRTLSICKFIAGDFYVDRSKYSANGGTEEIVYYSNLTNEEKQKLLNYELSIYRCEGNWEEKLMWFRRINIAGKTLSDQEIRNAIYNGPYINDAKRYLSKNNGAGYNLGKDYLNGEFNRQAYLEIALKWISEQEEKNIDSYMAEHQFDEDATKLWEYFTNVISWIKSIFPEYKREMKGLPWGTFYNKYGKNSYDPELNTKKVNELMADEEITNNKGVFEYILTGNIKALSLREFDENDRRTKYEQQKGLCNICHKPFDYEVMHADHIIPWSKGGKTTLDNCQMLCRDCNLAKSAQVQE